MAKKSLNLHLGKDSLASFDEALSEEARDKLRNSSSEQIDKTDFGGGSVLYIFTNGPYTPKWYEDIGRHFPVKGHLTTRSAAGILLFRQNDRIFASTFSHGWMYLDPYKFEGDFGLRTAINALDESKLRRLERSNLGDALRAVALSPFQRGLTSFGLDDALDLIRKISGRTRDSSTDDTMTGSRSLKLTGDYELTDLPEIASDAISYYNSTDYKNTSFSILDYVMPIEDRQLIDTLDHLTAASIQSNHDQFEFGLPISFEDQAVSYRFSGPGIRGTHPDLILRNYIDEMSRKSKEITVATLKSHKIIARFDDDQKPDASWPIRTSLIGSLIYDNERYAINEGEWYRIEQQFKESIEIEYKSIVEDWPKQPGPFRKIFSESSSHFEPESEYNSRFAAENGYLLLDRVMIRVPGIERSEFESCDVLDIEGKRFIHVKKSARRSSVLSHFFKQGTNSARNFSTFEDTWSQLGQIIMDLGGQAAAESFNRVRDDARQWKVEFVIADTPRANGEFNIPFFSKVSLRDEVRALRAMKYDVSLRFIRLSL